MTTTTSPTPEPTATMISAADAKSLASNLSLSLPSLLPTLLPSAQSLCRVPISNFHVGAVGLGVSGRIFFGGNIEFPGVPLNHSIHAEQFLITNAAVHDERHLTHIAVSSFPCGHCRQFFQELRHSSDIQILVTPSSTFSPLSSLLPHPFGPSDLLPSHSPLLLDPHANAVAVSGGSNPLLLAASEAARRSRAPYSGCYAGVAVEDSEGKVYAGSYAESAAYNPSMGPVQAALVAFVVKGNVKREFKEIKKAVLVERKDVLVSQEGTVRVLMAAVAPECDVEVHHCGGEDEKS